MNNKIIKIGTCIIIIILVLITGIIVYDRITINNTYSINEKNINIPIFVYHDIVDDESKIQYEYMQTSKYVFEKQIKGLQSLGYKFITYDDLRKFKNNEVKLNKKSCLITFDDGLEGVYDNVYPVAKKYNIPFTMFIIPDTVGQIGYLTWDEIKEMNESGHATVASHSVGHPEFTSLTAEEAVENVNNSYRMIEENIGEQSLKIFTYPYGLYTEEQIERLGKEGYIQNLTDNKINKSKNLDLSRLHRCYPLSDSVFKMELKIIYRTIRYN